MGVIDKVAIGPIAFNTVEELKSKTWMVTGPP